MEARKSASILAMVLIIAIFPTTLPGTNHVVTGSSEALETKRVYLPLSLSGSSPATFGYGIQAHWIHNDHTQIVNHTKAIGFNWTKQQVEWKAIESGGKGQYDWGEVDRLVNSATANGLKILLSVVKAPTWARPGGADLSVEGPPANPQDFADFLGAMAARYKGKVQAYQVWNEQNLHYAWGNQPIDPAGYVALLKPCYAAIKAQDPSAVVVSGALTPTGAPAPWAMDDPTYLELMYQNGLKDYCDVVGASAPGYNNPPDAQLGYTDPTEPTWKNHRSFFFRETLESYRSIMTAQMDGDKAIWVTEFGWASESDPNSGYDFARDNTLEEQAQYIVRAYEMGHDWEWVGAMFLFNLNFGVLAPYSEMAYYSLLRPDPVPAYWAIAAMPK